MPITILPQDQDGKELFNAISSFFHTFEARKLLRKCNAQKEKGVPVLDIFNSRLACESWRRIRVSLLTFSLPNPCALHSTPVGSCVFSGRSMYMQQKTGSFRESFSKNTFYRFLNCPKINWLRFTTLLWLMTAFLNVPAARKLNSAPGFSIIHHEILQRLSPYDAWMDGWKYISSDKQQSSGFFKS